MLYKKIFTELKKNRIRYLVIGGIAVNLHGYSRVTGDLDIMIAINDSKEVSKFTAMVKKIGLKPVAPVRLEDLQDAEKRAIWKKEKKLVVFSVYNPKNELEQVDVMIENPIDFNKAYSSRKSIKAGDLLINTVAIDDLIKLKEISGRKRDKIDVKALEKIKEL